jgi:PKD repeat protein
MPDANFDYQVTWRDVIFASRLIDQGDYIWYFDDGGDTLMGTDVTRHYYEDKTYNVSLVVKSPFGCVDSVTKPVTINSLSVVNAEIPKVTVYPNPSNGSLIITLPTGIQALEFQLINAVGEVVWRNSEINSNEILRTHLEVNPGVYQLIIRTNTEVIKTSVLFTD